MVSYPIRLAAISVSILTLTLFFPARNVAVAQDTATKDARPQSMSFEQHPFPGITLIERYDRSPRKLQITVLRLDLTQPGLRFRVTPAAKEGGQETRLQRTVDYVRDQQAQLGINLNYFSPVAAAGTPADLLGVSMSDGDLYSPPDPENFRPYPEHAPYVHAVITRGHDVLLGLSNDQFNTMLQSGVEAEQGFAAGPMILNDGHFTGAKFGRHPRTAIGLTEDGRTMVLMTVDGRREYTDGVTLEELAALMKQYGCVQAMNLDGGGSSSMVIADPQSRYINSAFGRPVGSNLAIFAPHFQGEIRSVTFQPGQPGDDVAIDTQIASSQPDRSLSEAIRITIDSQDDQEGYTAYLLRFERLFGNGQGQIPPGSRIIEATLTLHGVDPGSGGSLHRMIQPWNEEASWNTFGGNGLEVENFERMIVADSQALGTIGDQPIPVTASLRAWAVQPQSNQGWVILPLGSDGWDILTTESDQPPSLTVRYIAP